MRVCSREKNHKKQLADKVIRTVKIDKSFGQAFSKACAVKGAEPLSPSAEGEIFLLAFLFDNFFFAPPACKEKVAKKFVLFNESAVL